MSISFSPTPFRPHPLLRHAHVQSTWGTLFSRRFDRPDWMRTGQPRVFELEDGDRLHAVMHVHPDDPERKRPMIVLLHGLGGHQDSHYVKGLSVKAFDLGFHSLRLSYRGCAGPAQDARRLYNGQMTGDVDTVLRAIAKEGDWPIGLAGVSLGANKLLRLLATYQENVPVTLFGAVAISPPIDYIATNTELARGLNLVYNKYFMIRLHQQHRRRLAAFTHDQAIVSQSKLALSTRWLREHDENVTAPEGGFESADDYYSKAGTGDGLALIRVPTLIIHAQDDPFIPFQMFADRQQLIENNPALTTLFTERGGHVGFKQAIGEQTEPWMDDYWAENQALVYLRASYAAAQSSS